MMVKADNNCLVDVDKVASEYRKIWDILREYLSCLSRYKCRADSLCGKFYYLTADTLTKIQDMLNYNIVHEIPLLDGIGDIYNKFECSEITKEVKQITGGNNIDELMRGTLAAWDNAKENVFNYVYGELFPNA